MVAKGQSEEAERQQTLEKVVDNDWKMYAWFWGGLFAFLTILTVSCKVEKHLQFKVAAEAGLEQHQPPGVNNDVIWVKPK
jgi:hypothetical protein